MAYRRVSLPVLKLTKRPAVGQPSHDFTHGDIPTESTCIPRDCEETSHDGEEMLLPFDTSAEPTLHELESRAVAAGWQKIRQDILDVVTESAALHHDQSCLDCKRLASLRCQDCGPLGFFCPECFENSHKAVNLFHVPEKWENDHYVPLTRICYIDVRPDHICETKKNLLLFCLDEHGMEHKLHFSYCLCETLVKTMCRAKLWPATPTNPQYAFSFGLFDWMEALLLECQVSVKDFCNALTFRAPFRMETKKGFYPAMINAFEEFRFMKHNLRNVSHITSKLDSGNICPGCPQSGGVKIYAMDALFGLPRKKSAGTSYQEPLLGSLFFGDQSAVDQFVAESSKIKSDSSACNDFLAGSMLRSASRFHALDETALFGCACRHEFPRLFINLRHGERLVYAVWMMENIISNQISSGSKLYFMYDIACTLFRHLQSAGRVDILTSCSLCLPTFHSYGHKASCQVLHGPRRCEGIGLSDGETMERMWSYLRRFSRMTKEMRPSHRIDVISSALLHYGMLKKKKLANLLLIRFERALKVKAVAEESLQDSPTVQGEIQKWLSEEEASCRSEKVQCLESQRLLPLDHQYTEKQAENLCKSEQLLLALWQSSQRRLFLLKLKGKYADGQKIAKKLSLQISKESSKIQSLLKEYNSCELPSPHANSLSTSDVFNPSILEDQLKRLGTWCATGRETRR